jgi:hypothetical protein
MDFEEKAERGLERLPKMDPEIWDRQGIYREVGGDQRKAPFKGGQSIGVRRVMAGIEKAAVEEYGGGSGHAIQAGWNSGAQEALRKAILEAPTRKVRMASIHGLQAAVDANIVRRKIKEIASTDEVDEPAVVKFRGKLYLIDGYHSLTALKLGGVKSVLASVASL